MGLLEKLGLRRRKSRRERLQEAVAETVESVVDESRRQAPKVKKAAKKTIKEARAVASDAADTLRDKAGDAASSASTLGSEASDQFSDLLAALGSKATDWEKLAASLLDDVQEKTGDVAEKASDTLDEARAGMAKRRKARRKGYPGMTTWLLRLGLGFWFIQSLRSKDMTAYIDYEAGEKMRKAADGHPVAWYKDLLDDFLVPNASLVALGTLIATLLTAIGYITGINRRLAALMGILISGNKMMLEYEDQELRGQNIVAMLAQLLLLRTGG